MKNNCSRCHCTERKLYKYKNEVLCNICLMAELKIGQCYICLTNGGLYLNAENAFKDLGAVEIPTINKENGNDRE